MVEWTKVLMAIGVILSSGYVYCNFKTAESTTSINELTYAAFGQYLLAIDARLANQMEEYDNYVSRAGAGLQNYNDLNNKRQDWAKIGPIFLMSSLFFNSAALLLALLERDKKKNIK